MSRSLYPPARAVLFVIGMSFLCLSIGAAAQQSPSSCATGANRLRPLGEVVPANTTVNSPPNVSWTTTERMMSDFLLSGKPRDICTSTVVIGAHRQPHTQFTSLFGDPADYQGNGNPAFVLGNPTVAGSGNQIFGSQLSAIPEDSLVLSTLQDGVTNAHQLPTPSIIETDALPTLDNIYVMNHDYTWNRNLYGLSTDPPNLVSSRAYSWVEDHTLAVWSNNYSQLNTSLKVPTIDQFFHALRGESVVAQVHVRSIPDLINVAQIALNDDMLFLSDGQTPTQTINPPQIYFDMHLYDFCSYVYDKGYTKKPVFSYWSADSWIGCLSYWPQVSKDVNSALNSGDGGLFLDIPLEINIFNDASYWTLGSAFTSNITTTDGALATLKNCSYAALQAKTQTCKEGDPLGSSALSFFGFDVTDPVNLQQPKINTIAAWAKNNGFNVSRTDFYPIVNVGSAYCQPKTNGYPLTYWCPSGDELLNFSRWEYALGLTKDGDMGAVKTPQISPNLLITDNPFYDEYNLLGSNAWTKRYTNRAVVENAVATGQPIPWLTNTLPGLTPMGDWQLCAAAGQTCSPATGPGARIAFGTSGNFLYLDLVGSASIPCLAQSFGPDPNPGTAESCYVTQEPLGFPDGSYTLTNMSSRLVLDGGQSTLDQQAFNSATSQQWKLMNLGNGFFQIINLSTRMALDGTNQTQGGSIVQNPPLPVASQMWGLIASPDGSYCLWNSASGYTLAVAGSSSSAGATVNLGGYGATSQEWALQPTDTQVSLGPDAGDPSYPAPPNNQIDVAQGVYVLVNASQGATLKQDDAAGDVGAANTYSPTFIGEQWSLVQLDAGYGIVDNKTGLALNGAAGGSVSGTTYDWTNPTANLLWMFQPNTDGTYTIINQGTGYTLAMTNSNGEITVQQSSSATGPGTTWYLQFASPQYSGTATISNHLSGYVVNSASQTKVGGQQAVQGQNQEEAFTITLQSNNSYTLTSTVTGNLLDVGTNYTSGSPILTNPANGNLSQEWNITSNGDGTYTFISATTGLALTVTGESTSANTGLIQSPWTGQLNSQSWVLDPVY